MRSRPEASPRSHAGIRPTPEQAEISAGSFAITPVAPEPLGRTFRTVVEQRDTARAGRSQLQGRRTAQVEMWTSSIVTDPATASARRLHGCNDLATDFVATGTDRRADPCGPDLSRSNAEMPGSECRQTRCDPAPAGVDHRRTMLRQQRDRQAVGRPNQGRQPEFGYQQPIRDPGAAGHRFHDVGRVALLGPADPESSGNSRRTSGLGGGGPRRRAAEEEQLPALLLELPAHLSGRKTRPEVVHLVEQRRCPGHVADPKPGERRALL